MDFVQLIYQVQLVSYISVALLTKAVNMYPLNINKIQEQCSYRLKSDVSCK